MRNNLYINYKNRKYNNILGSLIAFCKVYRGSIFNRAIFKKSIGQTLIDHKDIYKISKEIIPIVKAKTY